MPIGWMTLLQNVPWTEVIRNAPKLADGAKNLWDAVSGKRGSTIEAAVARPAGQGRPATTEAMADRLAALEAAVEAQHEQLVASSRLIKALADQNTQLVARIEANRLRALRMTLAIGVTALVAVVAAVLALASGG